MVHTKVVILNATYNFVLDNLFYLRSFKVPTICFRLSDSEIHFIYFFQTTSNVDMVYSLYRSCIPHCDIQICT
jgi:hypothetical protein